VWTVVLSGTTLPGTGLVPDPPLPPVEGFVVGATGAVVVVEPSFGGMSGGDDFAVSTKATVSDSFRLARSSWPLLLVECAVFTSTPPDVGRLYPDGAAVSTTQ
jgi:hypothetical protein